MLIPRLKDQLSNSHQTENTFCTEKEILIIFIRLRWCCGPFSGSILRVAGVFGTTDFLRGQDVSPTPNLQRTC